MQAIIPDPMASDALDCFDERMREERRFDFDFTAIYKRSLDDSEEFKFNFKEGNKAMEAIIKVPFDDFSEVVCIREVKDRANDLLNRMMGKNRIGGK